MTLPIASCIIAINPETGEILSATRKGTIDNWGTIGGKQDPGESPIECAKREFKEETGVELSVRPKCIAIKECSAADVGGQDYLVHLFLVTDLVDTQRIYEVYKSGARQVEPGIWTGYVPYQKLLNGAFKKFNGEIVDIIIRNLFNLRSTAR